MSASATANSARHTKKDLLVAVVGYTGGVGTCLLKAMKEIQLEPFALVRSSTMSFPATTATPVPLNFDDLVHRLTETSKKEGRVPIIADVTASLKLQQTHYAKWLSAGISICTANKGIFAASEATYEELLQIVKEKNDTAASSPRLLHETTVGAGLPVLGTLRSLVESSHQIQSVEGILSGTLAFVLGQVAGGKQTLSQAVLQAKELGYTEPDPRDDLNGKDVARKAVILARIAGMKGIELEGLKIESLVPPELESVSVETFLQDLPKYDDEMAQRVAKTEAKGDGYQMHYGAKVDVTNNKVDVGLLSCEPSHPFNNAGPDNMVAITTNYYTRPLVVQGAGAGGDVTATGVLADILQCAYQK